MDMGYLFMAAPAKRSHYSLPCTRGTPHPRSGAAAERSNPTSRERWLRGCRRAERSYSTFKVRRSDGEEIPLIQGKENSVEIP